MGIVLGHHDNGPKLAYGWHHGHLRWTPYWVQRAIVSTWNWMACRVWGHDWFPDFATADRMELDDEYAYHYGIKLEVCTSCSARRPCRPEWVNSE